MKCAFVDINGATRVRYWFRPDGRFLNAEASEKQYRKQGGFQLIRYEVELVDGTKLVVYTRKYGKAFWAEFKLIGNKLYEQSRHVGVPAWMKRKV